MESGSLPTNDNPQEGGVTTPDVAPEAATSDVGVTPDPVTPPVESPAAAGDSPSLDDRLAAILDNQHRQSTEMANLRRQIDENRASRPTGPAPAALDAGQLQEQRLQELSEANFYCPGCGRTSQYPRECTGRGEAPHAAIEMVSTDEVKNRPDPQTDPDGYRTWEQNHTAAPATVV